MLPLQYYGKRLVKEFRGTDSTKAAIDVAKKARSGSVNAGRNRFLLLTERSIKVLKRDTKVRQETQTSKGSFSKGIFT